MKVVPKNREPKVMFYEQHLAVWEQHAAELGTSPEVVAELRARTQAARDAYVALLAARQRALGKTVGFYDAVEAMATLGASVLKQIRAKAQASGDRGVYTLARVPPPADGSPIGSPGKPERFEVELTEIGTLKLTWSCKNPAGSQGTMYQVSRRLGADGPFVLLGVTGKKRLTDTTIPLGTGVVTYEIRAVRSTAVGPAAQFQVSFGNDGHLPISFTGTRRDATTIAA